MKYLSKENIKNKRCNEDKSKNSTEIRKKLSKKADNCLYQKKRNRTSN